MRAIEEIEQAHSVLGSIVTGQVILPNLPASGMRNIKHLASAMAWALGQADGESFGLDLVKLNDDILSEGVKREDLPNWLESKKGAAQTDIVKIDGMLAEIDTQPALDPVADRREVLNIHRARLEDYILQLSEAHVMPWPAGPVIRSLDDIDAYIEALKRYGDFNEDDFDLEVNSDDDDSGRAANIVPLSPFVSI